MTSANFALEPTAASPSVCCCDGRFAGPRFRRCPVPGGCGSAWRYALSYTLEKMKRFCIVAMLAWCVTARATGPEYQSSRAWVIEQCATNRIPAKEQVYVATTPGSGDPSFVAVLRYRKDLSIRELIDQTRFRGTNAAVTVLRSRQPGTPVFGAMVKAGERPAFSLKPLDMVWIGDPRQPST
jgi:hypothetical protein